MIRVKICGICDLEAAKSAVDAGADLIGFHFCDSDRRVSPEEAKAIVDELFVRPKIVGVFIDESPEEVRRIAEYVDLDSIASAVRSMASTLVPITAVTRSRRRRA